MMIELRGSTDQLAATRNRCLSARCSARDCNGRYHAPTADNEILEQALRMNTSILHSCSYSCSCSKVCRDCSFVK